MSASFERELQLSECGTAGKSRWTCERFSHLEVIVVITNEQLLRLSYSLKCRNKIATLTLGEFAAASQTYAGTGTLRYTAIQNADQLPVSRGAWIVSRKPLAHSVADTVVEGAAFCRRQRNPVPLDDVLSFRRLWRNRRPHAKSGGASTAVF
jgi:hypothetical protein